MSIPQPPTPRPRRPFRLLRVIVVALGLLGLLGLVAWRARPDITAWIALHNGKTALLGDDPAAARQYLDQCLATWPDSAEAHFLAARAAIKCRDMDSASQHLAEAGRCGWPAEQLAEEREAFNVECDRIGEAALRELAAEFRWPEADLLTRRWVELRPEGLAGWKARAMVLERMRRLVEGVEAMRRAVKVAPNDRAARFDLARLLLESRAGVAEAAEQLEWLDRTGPNDPTVLVQLAICREAQGRPDEAVVLLDRAIAIGPPTPTALFVRGRLERDRRNPAAAVQFLRRAAALNPSDPPTLYLLLLALQEAGYPAEARQVEARWKQATVDMTRVGDLGRAIGRDPKNPDLRREMGELFIRNGRDAEGLRWLESALKEQPEHIPTHRFLADYYARTGRPDLAAQHRVFLPDLPRP